MAAMFHITVFWVTSYSPDGARNISADHTASTFRVTRTARRSCTHSSPISRLGVRRFISGNGYRLFRRCLSHSSKTYHGCFLSNPSQFTNFPSNSPYSISATMQLKNKQVVNFQRSRKYVPRKACYHIRLRAVITLNTQR